MKFIIAAALLILSCVCLNTLVNSKELSSITSNLKQNKRKAEKSLKRNDADQLADDPVDDIEEEESTNLEEEDEEAPTKKLRTGKSNKASKSVSKASKGDKVATPIKKTRVDPPEKLNLTLSQKWKLLFTVNREVVECASPKIEVKEDPIELDDEDDKEAKATLMVAPFKARDEYSIKELGFGYSAYFFDFLDATLQKRVLESFTEMWKDALAIKPTDEQYEDPYALATMLNGKPRKMADINAEESTNLLKKLKLIFPKFDEITWMKSLDAFKINAIVTQWKWDYPLGTPDPAKYLISNYDFNGDGRLSVQEFLIASIYTNRKVLGGQQCQHCYSKLIHDLIDPIFHFADCDSDLRVTAEELWKGLKLIKQDHHNSYYKCIYEKSNYRTSAVNDFILKTGYNKRGTITSEEFRLGILLGYWTRHVNKDGIIVDDAYNRKKDRWIHGKDTKCDEIITAIKATKRAALAEKLKKNK